MAWSNLFPAPQQQTLSAKYDSASAAYQGLQAKFVPRNLDNTIFDCTPATGVDVIAMNIAGKSSFRIETELGGTLVAADATGITISLSAADLATLTDLGTANASFVLKVTDGTNQIVLGYGSLNTAYVR